VAPVISPCVASSSASTCSRRLALAKEVPLPRAKPLAAAHPPSLAPVPEVLPLHDAEAWPSDCALRLAEIARFAHQPSLSAGMRLKGGGYDRMQPASLTQNSRSRAIASQVSPVLVSRQPKREKEEPK
jgi:hypothetical protein